MTIKYSWQKVLKGILHTDEEDSHQTQEHRKEQISQEE
jgi:hypothetical protein